MAMLKVKDYVVVNVETTGLYPKYSEITQICAVKVVDDREVDFFNMYVKPKCLISQDIEKLTGITNEMVKDALNIEEVMPKVLSFVGDNYLVSYNAKFDIDFINYYLPSGVNKFTQYIDILDFAKEKLFHMPNYNFLTVCKKLKIDVPNSLMEETKQMATAYKILRDKKYNAVFLDIDGVINNEQTKTTFNPYLRIDSKLVQKLAHIVYSTDSAIFLISDWKEYWEKEDKKKQDECANFLDYTLSCEGLKIADKVEGPSCERGANIKKFLSKHEDLENFVILDDIVFDYILEGYEKNYIQTSSQSGLTFEDVENAIIKLNKF